MTNSLLNKKKSLLALISSGAVVQLLPLLSIPFLTRYYSPLDFKSFILFLSCILIVSPIVSLRLEHTIVANNESNMCVFKLTRIIAILSLLTSIPITFGVVFFVTVVMGETYHSSLIVWFYLALTSNVLVLILTNLLIRTGLFTTLSTARVIKALFDFIVAMLFVVFINKGYLGLFLGYIVGGWFFILYAYSKTFLFGNNENNKGAINLQALIAAFSKYDVPAALLNTLTLQLPVIIISAISPPLFAGLYVLANKICSAPSMLINNSLGFIFRNEASEYIRNQDSFYGVYKKALKKLLIIFFITLLGFILFPDEYWLILLGEEWSGIGQIIVILAPLAAVRVISLPFSYVFYLTNSMKKNLIFQLVLLPIVLVLFAIPYAFELNDYVVLACYVFGMIVYYFIYIYFQYYLSKQYIPVRCGEES